MTMAHYSPGTSVIVGGMKGIGLEFAKLAVADAAHLILVDTDMEVLEAAREALEGMGSAEIHLVAEDLLIPDSGEEIYSACLLYQLLAQPPAPIGLLVNVMEFISPEGEDAWQTDWMEPQMHISNTLTLSEKFLQDMEMQRQGVIMNVIVRQEDQMEVDQSMMFDHLQDMLLEVSAQLNAQQAKSDVRMHTLSYSGNSFLLQADIPPDEVAHDLLPETTSARDLADFGYQVARSQLIRRRSGV